MEATAARHPSGSERPAPEHVPPSLVYRFDFNSDPVFLADPYDAFTRVHTERPRIFYTPGAYAGWVVTRFEDARDILQRTDVFSSKGSADFAAEDGDPQRPWDLIPLELDPPEHAKYRALLNPVLSPKEVDRLDATIRRVTIDLIEGFKAAGQCDFLEDFARPMPTSVFVGLMGLPEDRRDQFIDWTVELLHSNDPERQHAATESIMGYLHELVADRSAAPTGDLVSKVLALQIDGRPVAQDEALGFCFLLFVAGLDTVTSVLGNIFRYLAETPAAQQKLRDNPALIPDAVEELLRAFSVINLNRRVVADVELHGVTMKKGDRVLIFLPAANRDAAAFDDPAAIDFHRQASKHLAFSAGPHRCAGSHLARRELRIALEQFVARIPPFKIAPEAHLMMHGGGVLGQDNVPLVWSAS